MLWVCPSHPLLQQQFFLASLQDELAAACLHWFEWQVCWTSLALSPNAFTCSVNCTSMSTMSHLVFAVGWGRKMKHNPDNPSKFTGIVKMKDELTFMTRRDLRCVSGYPGSYISKGSNIHGYILWSWYLFKQPSTVVAPFQSHNFKQLSNIPSTSSDLEAVTRDGKTTLVPWLGFRPGQSSFSLLFRQSC